MITERILSRSAFLCPRCSLLRGRNRPPWLPQRPIAPLQSFRTSAVAQNQKLSRAQPDKPSTPVAKVADPAPAATKAKVASRDPLQLPDKSATEQRKADWAIMKEMSRYLWPKDNVGAKA